MPAGGELAALFARRAQPTDEDNDSAVGVTESMEAIRVPQSPTRAPAPSTRPPILSSPVRLPPPQMPAAASDEPPAKASTASQNEDLKAKFESRNLEVGIPTPTFLANARANLKKPGQKLDVVNSGYSSDSDAMNKIASSKHNYSSDSETPSKKFEKSVSASGPVRGSSFRNSTAADNSTSISVGRSFTSDTGGKEKAGYGYAKSNSFKNDSSLRSASSSIDDSTIQRSNSFKDKAQEMQKNQRHLRTKSACSSNDLPVDEAAAAAASAIASSVRKNHTRSNSESGITKTDTLAARRSRMVAARGPSGKDVLSPNSSSISETTATSIAGKHKKSSPSNCRREKLLARVRASQGSNNGKINKPKAINTGADTSTAFDASKTSIISPKRDEFEVLFADDDNALTFEQLPDNCIDSKGSIDSISNEMLLHQQYALNTSTSTNGSSATLPTANIKPKIANTKKLTPDRGGSGRESKEESRLHNASTPKIRGNGNYRRETYENDMEVIGENHNNQGNNNNSQMNIKSVPSGESGATPIPSFQQQKLQQQKQQQIDLPQELRQYPPQSTPRRDSISQAYPLRQSPSQMSQMSGITTPSCFPQDFPMVPSSGIGHFQQLQQPMLVGSPIHETASSEESGMLGVGQQSNNMVVAPSAFSPGIEAENRRLRDQLTSVTQRLEEKDAIISQLMKRIGDLESMDLRKMNITASFGQETTQSSQLSSSAWDSSQQSFPNTFSQRSSHDTESAFSNAMSVPASPGMRSSSTPKGGQQKKPNLHRSRSSGGGASMSKASPNTIQTSSTASVTTANSSVSRSKPRSGSLSGSGRRSRKSKSSNDDRKFVC